MAVASVSACGAITVDKLPQPGHNYSGGYTVVMEFANVLNLTDRAPVVMDGTQIGVVEAVSVGTDVVEVKTRISSSARIPAEIHAVLQQSTVLGDIYVALERDPDADAGGTVPPEGRIPVSQTASPPQLEDTLANLAHFVASGSIQRIQSSILEINRVTPERAEQVRAIASRMSANLADLSANIDVVDQWLRGVADTAAVLTESTPKLEYWLSPEGLLAFDRTSEASVAIGTLLPSIGSIYTGGFWLTPMLNSLGLAVGQVQQSKWGIEGEYTPWRKLFTAMFLPQDKYPAMNITSVQTADGRDITGNVDEVLRILGAIP
ncbi:hypothetical protein MKOR_30550 [Mycolicibacillus koreensis]|nr:hypothetical protein MKOR_30550 [Mycolicibacillus koreensis]